MNPKSKANAYRQNAVTTASPSQILLMLYEGAIRFMKRASEAIDNGDKVTKGINIGKAHDIVNELSNSLNHEVGAEVSKELERLYDFCTSQLLKANMENDKQALLGAIKIMETLNDAWKEAVQQVQKGNSGG